MFSSSWFCLLFGFRFERILVMVFEFRFLSLLMFEGSGFLVGFFCVFKLVCITVCIGFNSFFA